MSHAGVIDWTDWTDAVEGESATGTVGGVGVAFFGDVFFAQLADGVMVGGGASATTDYWTEGSPAPYTGNAVVDNRPPGFELIAFNEDSFNAVVFDSPVLNPVMAIVSQGRLGVPVSYDFDQSFTVLSEGQGFWGDGTYTHVGNTLTGNELHAVIQFQGLISEIEWFSTEENWHGFTIGVPQSDAPEPATLFLLGAGALGVIGSRRRRT
jgi:hypothetical protein